MRKAARKKNNQDDSKQAVDAGGDGNQNQDNEEKKAEEDEKQKEKEARANAKKEDLERIIRKHTKIYIDDLEPDYEYFNGDVMESITKVVMVILNETRRE